MSAEQSAEQPEQPDELLVAVVTEKGYRKPWGNYDHPGSIAYAVVHRPDRPGILGMPHQIVADEEKGYLTLEVRSLSPKGQAKDKETQDRIDAVQATLLNWDGTNPTLLAEALVDTGIRHHEYEGDRAISHLFAALRARGHKDGLSEALVSHGWYALPADQI